MSWFHLYIRFVSAEMAINGMIRFVILDNNILLENVGKIYIFVPMFLRSTMGVCSNTLSHDMRGVMVVVDECFRAPLE